MFTRDSFTYAAAFVVAWLPAGSAAFAQTYSNATPITIPDIGTTTPYPSTLSVAGAPSSPAYVSVTLHGFSHSYCSDVRVLLLGPGGQGILLLADAGGPGVAVNADLTFIPDGTVTIPITTVSVVAGVYAPSVYNPADLPDPAPDGPYGESLAPLIGANPNGNWRLYIFDDEAGDSGSIAGGWSISFNDTPPQPATAAMTYQGVLSSGGTPINGDANVRFTLCDNATVESSIAAVAPAITSNFTDIQNGMITATLDFGGVVDTLQALWLIIEVESPPGSGYVTLAPRQAISPAPQARAAKTAVSATNAVSAQIADGAVFANHAATSDNAANATALNNQPAEFYTNASNLSAGTVGQSVLPATSWAAAQLQNNSITGAFPAYTPIGGITQSLAMKQGVAVVSWSTTAFTDVAASGFLVRVRAVTNGSATLGPVSTFFFNQAGVHTTISGNAVIAIPATGSTNFSLEVTRSSGTGTYRTDVNDSFTASIINLGP